MYEVPQSWPYKDLKGMPPALLRCTVISCSDGNVGGGGGKRGRGQMDFGAYIIDVLT